MDAQHIDVTAPVREAVVSLAGLVGTLLSGPPTLGSSRLICVDGPSGAGKTTLGDRLSAVAGALTPSPVTVVHMDDLYDGWAGLVDAATVKVPQWLLRPLAAGEPGRYRRYDWAAQSYAEWHDVPSGGLVILEGCGSAAAPANNHASLRLWVETTADVRLQRGLARTDDAGQAELRRLLAAWKVDEDAHFEADGTRARADHIVLGDPAVPHDPATQLVVAG